LYTLPFAGAVPAALLAIIIETGFVGLAGSSSQPLNARVTAPSALVAEERALATKTIHRRCPACGGATSTPLRPARAIEPAIKPDERASSRTLSITPP